MKLLLKPVILYSIKAQLYDRYLIRPAYNSEIKLLCCCSATKLCLPLCNPMDYSTPGSSVLYYLPEFSQIQVH